MSSKSIRKVSAAALPAYCGATAAHSVVTSPLNLDSGTIAVRCGVLIDGISDKADVCP